MPKAFLSHSSKDKQRYVDIVARQIGHQNCIYDSLTFEEGMKSLEEIEKGLGKADLFVLFLSDDALKSKWVRSELAKANSRLNEELLERIFPIIIDPNINHEDSRIPKWLKKEYNLKYVSRPTVATRRIKQRLREISWNFHPRLKERQRIFVGRNNLIKEFEERMASLDLPTATCIIASGFSGIGRKVFLKHCLKKTNEIDESYEPPLIRLNSHESIEDFVYKIYDLGFSEPKDLTNFMSKTPREKERLALTLVEDFQKAREIIFIDDNRSIVTPARKLSNWFDNILRQLVGGDQLSFCVASSVRLDHSNIRQKDNLFTLSIPELEKQERTGLLKRYSEFERLALDNEDLRFFTNLQAGFPEQVLYTVELIKDLGVDGAKEKPELIVDFNTERITYILAQYEDNKIALNFLHLLSSFDFISYDFIFEIVGTDVVYRDLLNRFFAHAICEHLGANKEYVRVNDAIRDYVLRTKHVIETKFKQRMRDHLEKFLSTYETEEKDVSDFFFSMKEALASGAQIDEKYLIPSHFLKTMTELYDLHRRYDDVIRLADRVLQQEEYMDEFIIFQIRYYLCLALAKLRDQRFMDEVMKISGHEHNFLMGFYYRLTGNNSEAIARFNRALETEPRFPRARRELVQAYLNVEAYDEALELAKQNYEGGKNNPFQIHAYFTCLTRSDHNFEHASIAEELLQGLEKINSEKANEMSLEAKALYYAIYHQDQDKAFYYIERAIGSFPNSPYPVLAKFEICERLKRIDKMNEVVDRLAKMINPRSYHYNAYLLRKAYFWAYQGNARKANQTIAELRRYPQNLLERARHRIESIVAGSPY